MCYEYWLLVEKLREELIKIRKDKKISKKQLAKSAQISEYKLNKIEKYGIYYTLDLFKICYALDIKVHEILRKIGY